LGINYNYENFVIESSLLSKEKMERLIVFLVNSTLNGELTTRGFNKSEKDNELFFILFGDLSKSGETPKTFNTLISEIKSKSNSELSELEQNLIELDKDITSIKNKALINVIQKASFDYDFIIKSIIYI